MRIIPLGDSAVTIQLSSPDRARAVAGALKTQQLPGVIDALAAFAGVTVYYDSAELKYCHLCDWIKKLAHAMSEEPALEDSRSVEIPVRYGGDAGPDLADVSRAAGLSVAEVIALHQATEYVVLAVGFMPGFAYLGGLPDVLQTPRRRTPRTIVPAGSVGIGGMYTGVYPFASPGGWNLIGQTDAVLFDPNRSSAALFQVGQRVRFVARG